MQTWNFVLLFKFSAGRQFCTPKPARTQSPKPLPHPSISGEPCLQMDNNRLSDDLIIGLILKGGSVLYIKTGAVKRFPDFRMDHNTTAGQKIEQLKKYLRDDLGLTAASVELMGHIQRDPRDIMQYFINAHIYIYRITIPPDQFITPPPGAAEIGFHDLKAGQDVGFSYKGKLMLDFLRDWTVPDLKRLDARDIRGWYNKWLGLHLKSAYQEYIEAEIDECHAGDDSFACEIEEIVKQTEAEKNAALGGEVENTFQESQQLADLIEQTADGMGHEAPGASPGAAQAVPDLQLSALNEIKNHLSGKLYRLRSSHLNDREMRIAYRLMGGLLKRTNDLMEKYEADGAKLGYDQELKTLMYELESESLSPFEKRRG